MQPHYWNANREGRKRQVFVGQRNFYDGRKWNVIDGGFQEDSGKWTANQIPGSYSIPPLATGSAHFTVNEKWDPFTNSEIHEPEWTLEITPENVLPVAGHRDDDDPSKIVFPGAFGLNVDLRYTVWTGQLAPRVTREVVIRKEPPGDHNLTYAWRIRNDNARVWVHWEGKLVRPWSGNITDAIVGHDDRILIRSGKSANSESQVRGSGVRAPVAWYYKPDGTLVTRRISLNIIILTPDTVRVEKVIPREFIREAFAVGATAVMADDTNTFRPDPDVESTSFDGYVDRGLGAYSWSACRNGAGASRNDSGQELFCYLRARGTPNWDQMHRSMILFDTSSLTGQSVASATLGLTGASQGSAISGAGGFGAALVESVTASNTAATNSDFENMLSTRLADTDIQHSNTWSGQQFTFTLNSLGLANINVSGISKFGIRHSYDADNSEPASNVLFDLDYLTFRSAEYAGTGSDPYLEVVTADPAPMPLIYQRYHG